MRAEGAGEKMKKPTVCGSRTEINAQSKQQLYSEKNTYSQKVISMDN